MFHTVRLHKKFSLYKNNCSGDRVVENFRCAIIVRKFFVSKTSLIFYLVLYIYIYIIQQFSLKYVVLESTLLSVC